MNSFDRIAGYKKEKEELLALVELFNNREKYEKKGATLPKGIIFYGPAGTGKTLFSEVLAKECTLNTINISISDAATDNNICKRIKKAFLQSKKSKIPTMIFFDELDKVLPNSEEKYYTDKSKAILAQLLTLISGMEKTSNTVFVATCNDYYALPESITRPGRFDKKIYLGLPDYATRIAILNLYMNASHTNFELSAESIGKLAEDFSPAALKTLVNECIIASDENNYISEKKIREKIIEIKEESLPDEKSYHTYAIDAVRNIGGFLLARSYNSGDYVLTVDENCVCNKFLDAVITGANYDYDYDDENDNQSNASSIFSKSDIIAAITALLGAFAAQELIFNQTYDNLIQNFDIIDCLLFRMSVCGMLGLEFYHDIDSKYYYSEKIRERLEEKFLKIKSECYEKAKDTVTKNEHLIKKLVPILIQRKSIEKKECEALLLSLGGIN